MCNNIKISYAIMVHNEIEELKRELATINGIA